MYWQKFAERLVNGDRPFPLSRSLKMSWTWSEKEGSWTFRSQDHSLPGAKVHRPLADGTVHCAGSATYQLCFRLPIPNRTLTLNRNPITDPNNPNPKNNKKRKRHRNEIEYIVISKSTFPRDGEGS